MGSVGVLKIIPVVRKYEPTEFRCTCTVLKVIKHITLPIQTIMPVLTCIIRQKKNVCLGFPYLPYFFALKNAYPNILWSFWLKNR